MATTTKKETIAEETNAPKMVTVRIPRISKDQEDVFVSVNMNTYIIKRGVPVEVPDFVAEVLQHQEEMLQVAYDFESAKRSD
jgi:hypothetical protein